MPMFVNNTCRYHYRITNACLQVLADYVLALAKTQEQESASRDNYIENLRDFLSNNTEQFVDELLIAISTRSFDPNRAPLRPAAPTFQPTVTSRYEQQKPVDNSRKRSYYARDEEEGPHGSHSYQRDRPIKHARRGGRGQDNQRGARHFSQQFGMPAMPQLPAGMPQFDPNNPMAAFLAMQQAMGLMPGMPNGTSPSGRRCKDYDTKGFCAAGGSCPYEHGNDPFVIPEYDPNNSALLDIAPAPTSHFDTSRGEGGRRGRGRGRGRDNNTSRGGKRSNFSQIGPNRDTSITGIVVESIPAENCNEESVREFFSAFGNIDNVNVQPESKLAIIKFEDHDSARAAYQSPKVVFDNRFVKVYWAKAENGQSSSPARQGRSKSNGEDTDMAEGGGELDMEEITKRQEEAQRKHEEVKQQREQAEQQRAELDAKLKAMDAERKKMAELISKKTGKTASGTTASPVANGSQDNTTDEESEQTQALKAQLAKLEAEAKSLGIDPAEAATTNGAHSPHPPYRGRGTYRGRARGGRASYYPSTRGGPAWHPRGGIGGAVKRLDNRPKTIAVTLPSGTKFEDHDEALRQFLFFNNLNMTTLEKHPERDDTALVAFGQRFEGENFMRAASLANSELLHVGKVELTWYKPEGTDKGVNGGAAGIGSGTALGVESESGGAQREQAQQEVHSDLPDAPSQTFEMADEEDLDRWT